MPRYENDASKNHADVSALPPLDKLLVLERLFLETQSTSVQIIVWPGEYGAADSANKQLVSSDVWGS
jgi:hypothetical protein